MGLEIVKAKVKNVWGKRFEFLHITGSIVGLLGLAISFLGGLVAIFATGTSGIMVTDGKSFYPLAYTDPLLLKKGLYLIVTGFYMQAIEKIITKPNKSLFPLHIAIVIGMTIGLLFGQGIRNFYEIIGVVAQYLSLWVSKLP